MALTHSGGPTVIDDYLASSLSLYLDEGQATDNIIGYSALLWWLNQKGRTKVADGGVDIKVQLRYAKNNQGLWYSGADVLNTTANESLTEAVYEWGQCAVPIHITGKEKRANQSNPKQLLPLLQERADNAKMAIKDMLATALTASSNTTNGPDCLASIVSTTTSHGGISGTTYSWWQSQATSSGSFVSRGLKDLMTTYMLCTQGSDKPDLFYSADTDFRYYWQALQPQARFADGKSLDAGYDNLKFMGATWISDKYLTAGTIFLLNSNAIKFVTMKGANFEVNDEVRPANQDAFVKQVLLQCAMCTKERRKLGKLTSVSA